MKRTRLAAGLAGLAAAMLLACAPATYTQVQENTVKLQPTHTAVIISNVNGYTHLETHPDSNIELTMIKRVTGPDVKECERRINDLVIRIDSLSGNAVEITVIQPSPIDLYNYGVDMTVKLPAGLVADITSSNGEIRAVNLERRLRARTSNGTIDLDQITGDVDVRSSNGKLDLQGIHGSLEAGTSNGQIDADVSLPDSNGRCHLQASNGNIALRIPTTTSAEVFLSTSNANITVTNLTLQYTRNTKTYVEGRLGTGVNDILVSTSNGNITLTGY